MALADFDYDLPTEPIAQAPAETREAARLLVIDRARATLDDRRVADLPDLLRPGDCLVVNDSRVIPARVLARGRGAGAPVELLFLERDDAGALARAGAARAAAAARAPSCASAGRAARGGRRRRRRGPGRRAVRDGTHRGRCWRAHGLPPLPPYIARHAEPAAEDWERYQTVYARAPGSVAAPTAGLHFTPALLDALRARGGRGARA